MLRLSKHGAGSFNGLIRGCANGPRAPPSESPNVQTRPGFSVFCTTAARSG
jgi:hypothetical protein